MLVLVLVLAVSLGPGPEEVEPLAQLLVVVVRALGAAHRLPRPVCGFVFAIFGGVAVRVAHGVLWGWGVKDGGDNAYRALSFPWGLVVLTATEFPNLSFLCWYPKLSFLANRCYLWFFLFGNGW